MESGLGGVGEGVGERECSEILISVSEFPKSFPLIFSQMVYKRLTNVITNPHSGMWNPLATTFNQSTHYRMLININVFSNFD